MLTNDRTALQNRYQWLFLRYPYLIRPLVVNDRTKQQETIYPGIGESLRIEICAVKCGTFDDFFAAVNEIHQAVGSFQKPRRCIAFHADGSELTGFRIHNESKVLNRCRKFDLSQLRYLVSTWRKPCCVQGASMLVLIEVEYQEPK